MLDFIERLSGKEVNKRTVESFIKAGALDCLGFYRRQLMLSYVSVIDSVTQQRKKAITGQMTLFDFAGEEEKDSYSVTMPEVEEYEKGDLLSFEKEVLGVYISGHPLEEFEYTLRCYTNAATAYFDADEPKVKDGQSVVVGGMITNITIKTTKNNKMMAFLTLEDLVGVVEVIVFPNDYSRNKHLIVEDGRVIIRGKVSLGDDDKGKLICERILPFETNPEEIWIRFDTMDEYYEKEESLKQLLQTSKGTQSVAVYIVQNRSQKIMPEQVTFDETLLSQLMQQYGEQNVKFQAK